MPQVNKVPETVIRCVEGWNTSIRCRQCFTWNTTKHGTNKTPKINTVNKRRNRKGRKTKLKKGKGYRVKVFIYTLVVFIRLTEICDTLRFIQ